MMVTKMNNYFKMLGFYFFDFLGSAFNFVGSVLGVYPCSDWGIRFLLFSEGQRIGKEKVGRGKIRADQEEEAAYLEQEAKKENG